MRNQLVQQRAWPILFTAALLCSGCASSQRYPKQEWQGYPKYDVDPQVIYRIDDHRYLLMNNYPGCDYVRDFHYPMDVPRVYYRDDKLGISQQLSPAVAYYRGKLIIDAPNGNTIAFPAAPIGACTTRDTGCRDPGITYSTDAGRTWQWMPMEGRGSNVGFYNPNGHEKYTVTVTDDAIYLSMGYREAERKPIGSGISYETGHIPENQIQYGVPEPKAKTPSGMERLTCNPAIKPRSVTYHKITPTEYFELP